MDGEKGVPNDALSSLGLMSEVNAGPRDNFEKAGLWVGMSQRIEFLSKYRSRLEFDAIISLIVLVTNRNVMNEC